jgi:YD repeat-containing protein
VQPVTSNFYDKAGNITSTIDANGKTVQMQYDAFGRLTNTIDAVGNTISFEYDANGNQTALIDGNGSRTEFVYDGLNRKISTIYPDANHEDAEYDLLGNRIKRIDCNGAVTHYIYDARNRLDLVKYGSDPSDPTRTRDYVYDDAGNLLDVLEIDNQQSAISNACVSYSYDALNRVITETSVGVPHQYGYDLNGNRTNALYGVTGRNVAWTYDALNRISTISEYDPDDQYVVRNTQYAYDLNSKPVYREYPTGVEELRTFDAMGRLLTMTTTNSVNGESFSMDYLYDAVGSARQMVQNSWNLTGKAQDAVTTWSYDNRYRLTNETVITVGGVGGPATNSTSYSWDSADNRLSKTVYGSDMSEPSVTTYTNNALNQLLGYVETNSVSSVYSVVDYSYDPNGARTNKTIVVAGGGDPGSTNITAYTYDEDNRLTEVTDQGSGVSTFAYDYRSRRYYRETPSGTNLCVFDGGLSIQEYDATDIGLLDFGLSTTNLQTEYIRGEGMGGGVGGMVYSITTNGIICSHANHRGDVIARSDEDGSLKSFALYEAYGTRPYEWGDDPRRVIGRNQFVRLRLGFVGQPTGRWNHWRPTVCQPQWNDGDVLLRCKWQRNRLDRHQRHECGSLRV